MQFHQLMQQLGKELRLPDFAPDDAGACAVLFEDLNVSFHPDSQGDFMMVCVVARADPDDLHAQNILLRGNFFGDGVGACGVGVDASGHVALVQRVTCANISFPQFHQSLERFTNTADGFRTALGAASRAVH